MWALCQVSALCKVLSRPVFSWREETFGARAYMLKIGGQKIPATTVVLVLSDAFLVVLGLCVAILLRFHNFSMALGYLKSPDTPLRLALVLFACGLSLYYNDLYASEVINRRSALFVHLLQAVGAAWVTLAILYYFVPDHTLGR